MWDVCFFGHNVANAFALVLQLRHPCCARVSMFVSLGTTCPLLLP